MFVNSVKYVRAGYKELLAAFGRPDWEARREYPDRFKGDEYIGGVAYVDTGVDWDGKCHFDWALRTDTGVTFSIYDYKQTAAYDDEYTRDLTEINEFNVNAKTEDMESVELFLDRKGFKFVDAENPDNKLTARIGKMLENPNSKLREHIDEVLHKVEEERGSE